MKTIFFRADNRGTKDIGWLKSKFHLSFSDYYDPTRAAFGTLVAFNDDLLQAGKGFGTHPHGNMEIISVLLKGKMNHKDSMGYSTVIGEGGVQIMSAGTGLFHEEYNIGEEEVNFLQIWIQPKLLNVKPRYQLRHFPQEERKGMLKTIVSGEEGLDHCWINQNAKISLGYYEEEKQVDYGFIPVNKCLFLFIISGKINISGTDLFTGDALGVWETDSLPIHTSPGSSFILIETPVNQK